jgi:hypothetical protein
MGCALKYGMLVLCVFAMAPAACRKEAPKKKTKSEAVADASRQRRMVINFANGLRSVLEWRQTQPVTRTEPARQALIEAVAKKFAEVPAKDLPPEMEATWQQMMTLWHQLAKTPEAGPELIKQGGEITAKLNNLLAASGHPDVRL